VANAFSYIDTASAGQTYYYRVKAYNVAGDSGYSQEVSVTLPQSATNSFPSGMTLWLKANTGFPKNGMNTWLDQSGAGHNGALQNVTITSVAGLAAAWFNGTSAQVTLPTGLFSSSAEIFIVLKATWTNGNGNCRGLNSLGGTGTWSTYPCSDGTVCDGFATTVTKNMGQPPVNVTAINLYNASSQANDWVCRFNGSLFFRTTANATATPSSPNIGVSSYAGSVMEVMLFNRVLSVAERYTVGAYFNAAYGLVTNAPPAPTVHCQALSPQQIAVTWNAISNAACYQVERQVDSGGFVTLALLDEQTNYTDTIWNSSPITYRISAINCIGTNQTSLTTPLTYVSSPPPGSSVFVGTNLPVTLQSVAGSTPSLVNLYANGYLRQSWSSAPYQTTLTSTSPTRWNLMSLTYDTLGNSRYSGLFGVDSLNPIDSDGDGIPDCIDAFPYDPTRWLAPTIDPNDHTPPVITITQP
jgi:hypothetical protein